MRQGKTFKKSRPSGVFVFARGLEQPPGRRGKIAVCRSGLLPIQGPDEVAVMDMRPRSLVDQVIGVTETLEARPSWDDYFMATAFLLASRSACSRLHVGCVIVSGGPEKNRIIAAGYNGFLPGTPHRSRVRGGHEQATVHAEQNAIADAARRGSSVGGAIAYVTHFPCISCAKILAASGIRTIKYHVDYQNDPLVEEILAEAGVEMVKF